MRGPQPKFPWGGGAAPATPMRGPKPTFPYPDPNSFNPIQPAGGPDAPTNSWFQRPSGQPGNGAPALGDVDYPGGGYGGGAQSGGPWQTGPGRSPSGWSGPDSGGIGSDARFPTANYGPPHVGGSPTNPIAPQDQSGGSVWDHLTGIGQRIKNMMGQPDASSWGQQAADAGAIEGGNPAVSQPVDSGNNPAPTLPQPGPFGARGPAPTLKPVSRSLNVECHGQATMAAGLMVRVAERRRWSTWATGLLARPRRIRLLPAPQPELQPVPRPQASGATDHSRPIRPSPWCCARTRRPRAAAGAVAERHSPLRSISAAGVRQRPLRARPHRNCARAPRAGQGSACARGLSADAWTACAGNRRAWAG